MRRRRLVDLSYPHINVDTKEKSSKKESNSNNSFSIKELNTNLKALLYVLIAIQQLIEHRLL